MANSANATPVRDASALVHLSHYTKKARMWLLLVVFLVINVAGGAIVTWATNGGHWPAFSDSVRSTGYPVTIYILCLMCTALAAAPLIIFLLVGWYTRYLEFQNSLKQEALAAYLQRFWSNALIEALNDDLEARKTAAAAAAAPAAAAAAPAAAPAAATVTDWRKQSLEAPMICDRLFSRIYHDQYGLLPFVPAVCILLTFVHAAAAIVGWTYITSCCAKPEAQTCVFGLSAELIIASFGGAFMFVVSDTVASVLKGSLNVSDVYWYSLRLLLAVPLALVANRITGTAGFHVAFALSLGTLPVNQLLKVIRRYGDPATTPSAQEAKSAPDELLNLKGVTVAVSESLQAQGLTSIEQVATADPVRLAIRTGFSFRFTLQLASQAIVRRHFGKTAENLAEIGLSTVVPIYLLVHALNGDQKPGMPKFDDGDPAKIIAEAAALLLPNDDSVPREAVTRMKFRQIAAEEYTLMLASITPLDSSL